MMPNAEKRILWIEDDWDRLIGIMKPLESGYRITTAMSEKEALELLREETFDLIILDLIIPAGDEGQDDCDELIGIRLAKKIRYLGLMIPIIVLSVVNDRQTIYELKNIGISEFLVKGRCLPSYLSSRVEYVLSEHNE